MGQKGAGKVGQKGAGKVGQKGAGKVGREGEEEQPVANALREFFSGRPHWMNGLFVFCLYMTFVYMPFDMLKPLADDVEVWFGFMLHGAWAKATEPLHWAIYAAGAYGFWKMRPWMHPWAALYVGQVAIGMLVWSVLDPRYGLIGVVPFVLFGALAVVLWRSRGHFAG